MLTTVSDLSLLKELLPDWRLPQVVPASKDGKQSTTPAQVQEGSWAEPDSVRITKGKQEQIANYLAAVQNLLDAQDAGRLRCYSSEDAPRVFAGLRRQNFDSNFFGFEIGRIEPLVVAPTERWTEVERRNLQSYLTALLQEAAGHGFKQLSAYCEPSDFQLLQALSLCGFVPMDTTMRYELNLGEWAQNKREDRACRQSNYKTGSLTASDIRELRESDIDDLAAVTAQCFLDRARNINRFNSDPQFLETGKLPALYHTWFKNLARGELADQVFVAQDSQGRPLGFLSVQLPSHKPSTLASGQCGAIPMMAVAPEHQGRGIYASLVKHAFDWFISQKIETVELWTHISNTPNHRVWLKAGATLTYTVHCLHCDLRQLQ